MALEVLLPGLEMVQAVADRAQLAQFLPRLTELLDQRAVLLVLDNLESLLTDQGAWRDPRWADLMAALTGHRGESRVVLTSRVRPQGLDPRVRVEPVHALSLTESLLLARELPHLVRLLGEDPGTGPEVERRRELVRRALALVQGHPKLLELADAVAADPEALAAQLAAADQATEADDRDRLATFFDRGETELGTAHFVRTLGDWTRRVTATLPKPETFLFELLCCLEASDRFERIVDKVWPAVWRGRGQYDEPPPLAVTLAPLVEQGLVAVEADPVGYRIHPGVAEAGRAQANWRVQRLVDQVMAYYWQEIFRLAREIQGPVGGDAVLRAGRSAAPYLLRLEEWATAGELLGKVLLRDRSSGMLQAVLPLLRRIAEATRGTDEEPAHAGRLAAALGTTQPDEASGQLRLVLDQAVAEERFDQAGRVAGELALLLRDAWRVDEALAMSERKAEYTAKAGLGPWTQLLDQGRRQQLLIMLGRSDEVLAWVQDARDRMAALPEQSEQPEQVEPWNVREILLRIASEAAGELGRWQESLDLDAEVFASQHARGATDLEQAIVSFIGSIALIELGELDQAERLLLKCRKVFEDEAALGPLGRTLGLMAGLEWRRGHDEEALRLEKTAIRYAYVARYPEGVAAGHHNIANHFRRGDAEPALVLAHRLAAATIWSRLDREYDLSMSLDGAAQDLATAGDPPPLPGSFEELCRLVGQTEGVRLAELTARLPGTGSDDDLLAEVLRLVAGRAEPARQPEHDEA